MDDILNELQAQLKELQKFKEEASSEFYSA